MRYESQHIPIQNHLKTMGYTVTGKAISPKIYKVHFQIIF